MLEKKGGGWCIGRRTRTQDAGEPTRVDGTGAYRGKLQFHPKKRERSNSEHQGRGRQNYVRCNCLSPDKVLLQLWCVIGEELADA